MLTNQSKELMFYFDKIRLARNMTIGDFIHGIISERQYRRYIRGETNLNAQVVSLFSAKLGQKTEHILLNFESDRLKETQTINNFHNMIVNDNFEGSFELEKEYPFISISNKNNVYLYKFASLIRDYKLKKANSLTTVGEIKELIDYDTIKNHTTFSSSEIIILTSLLGFDNFNDRETILSLLKTYINHNDVVISGYNDRMLVLALYHLMKHYGSMGEQILLEDYALRAISINKEAKSIYLLEHFFYTLAYLYKKQNNLEKSNEYLYKCITTLCLDDTTYKIKRFDKLIHKNFNININEFLTNYKHDKSYD